MYSLSMDKEFTAEKQVLFRAFQKNLSKRFQESWQGNLPVFIGHFGEEKRGLTPVTSAKLQANLIFRPAHPWRSEKKGYICLQFVTLKHIYNESTVKIIPSFAFAAAGSVSGQDLYAD